MKVLDLDLQAPAISNIIRVCRQIIVDDGHPRAYDNVLFILYNSEVNLSKWTI